MQHHLVHLCDSRLRTASRFPIGSAVRRAVRIDGDRKIRCNDRRRSGPVGVEWQYAGMMCAASTLMLEFPCVSVTRRGSWHPGRAHSIWDANNSPHGRLCRGSDTPGRSWFVHVATLHRTSSSSCCGQHQTFRVEARRCHSPRDTGFGATDMDERCAVTRRAQSSPHAQPRQSPEESGPTVYANGALRIFRSTRPHFAACRSAGAGVARDSATGSALTTRTRPLQRSRS